MMTKEEVREIMSYCEGQKISYKTRLQELDIPLWKFYDAKRKHMANDNDFGGFLEILPGSQYFPNPIKPVRTRGRSKCKYDNTMPEMQAL